MFLPYKVDVPMERWPVANWVLMGITILVSFAMFGPLEEWQGTRGVEHPEIARALRELGVAQAQGPDLVNYFLLQPGNFRASQLMGNLFIHGSFMHLAGNMLFMWVFGNAVNAKIGHWKYVALYLGVGIAESCVWMLIGPGAPVLGASGAIMGMIGAFLLLYPLNEVSILYMFTLFYRGVFEVSAMWVIAAYFAFDVWGLMSSGVSRVAYLAHVAGFITGAAVMAAMLWWKLVEMDRSEKSLLQVWGWMPYVEEEVQPRSTLNPVTGRPYVQRVRQAEATRPAAPGGTATAQLPRARAKREEGPIPLD